MEEGHLQPLETPIYGFSATDTTEACVIQLKAGTYCTIVLWVRK